MHLKTDSKCTKQKPIEFKGEIDKFTIVARNFNPPFNNLENKGTENQQDGEDSRYTIDQLDILDA